MKYLIYAALAYGVWAGGAYLLGAIDSLIDTPYAHNRSSP
jgi:hypothetical protein